MGDLKNDGYLSADIINWIKKHRTENEALFLLSEEINKFAQEQMLKLDMHSKDYQELLVAGGFVRALSSFQGVILMLERGMIFEAGTLFRAQIEAMLVVAAAAKERKFAHRYILSDGVDRLHLMKNLLNSSGEITEIVKESFSWEDVESFKKQLKTDNINNILIKEIAQVAGYPNWYNAVYAYFSQIAAHPTPSSLGIYFYAPDGENIKEFCWGPDVCGIGATLTSAIECLVVVLNEVSNLFKKDWTGILDSIHARIKQLTKPEDDDFGYKKT